MRAAFDETRTDLSLCGDGLHRLAHLWWQTAMVRGKDFVMGRVLMMGVVAGGVVLAGVAMALAQPEPAEVRGVMSETELMQAYRVALDEIMEADQRQRSALAWGTTDVEEIARLDALPLEESMAEQARRKRAGILLDEETEKRLWAEQRALDQENTRRLMDWVERAGWPTEEMEARGFADPTAVLIHMSMEDAEWVLPVLRGEVLAGRMKPRTYAMIFDRKRQHDGLPQLYGTAMAFDVATRTVLPPAIVDVEETNAARAEIGMGAIEEYRVTDAETAAGG